MCGLNWYREQLERAEDNKERLAELKKMMEERYKISDLGLAELLELTPDILSTYKEIVLRLGSSEKR
ncbi:MAG TPA: hypothetical protein PKA28_03100 [Methylomusa anaerophila]|uniref:Uncharacterized protein n=1 Tax=Methylomusa anaerophila TaxID=1930071 RepID=A0A348ANT7_9FIRM|nr:hypothetical protein [Methylomusa anaerophila]BBB92735.1 hypothetical protein MAMMFC1_03430 [Methylomusa anaerophila]HML87412.1 hypothetical protein [Methylomusa anaerophila]